MLHPSSPGKTFTRLTEILDLGVDETYMKWYEVYWSQMTLMIMDFDVNYWSIYFDLFPYSNRRKVSRSVPWHLDLTGAAPPLRSSQTPGQWLVLSGPALVLWKTGFLQPRPRSWLSSTAWCLGKPIWRGIGSHPGTSSWLCFQVNLDPVVISQLCPLQLLDVCIRYTCQ